MASHSVGDGAGDSVTSFQLQQAPTVILHLMRMFLHHCLCPCHSLVHTERHSPGQKPRAAEETEREDLVVKITNQGHWVPSNSNAVASCSCWGYEDGRQRNEIHECTGLNHIHSFTPKPSVDVPPFPCSSPRTLAHLLHAFDWDQRSISPNCRRLCSNSKWKTTKSKCPKNLWTTPSTVCLMTTTKR